MTLELRNVTKRVGAETHIHETSLVLADGSFNILLGPTLAGKTTLMQLMAGLDRPTSGAVWFGGAQDTTVDLAGRQPGDEKRRGDVLVDGEIRVVDELLVDHRYVALLDGNAGNVAAAEPDLAAGRAIEAGDQLHQGRLAGERRAEERVEAAGLEGQAGRVDVHVRAYPLGDVFQLK
jgi:ABC-type branched-subunit amino acid transport system ATPase component